MDIKVLFPTLVGISHADSATIAAIDEEVVRHEDFLKSLLSHTWGDNVLSTFSQEPNIFAAAELHRLRKFIEDSIVEFIGMTRTGGGFAFDHSYTQSWMNITRKFGFQERHNHDLSAEGLPISGVYYFNTNGQDGDLAIFPTDMQYKLFGNQEIAPAVGKLVLFRSEVFHRVGVNLTDSDRVSFSFNYLLKGSAQHK